MREVPSCQRGGWEGFTEPPAGAATPESAGGLQKPGLHPPGAAAPSFQLCGSTRGPGGGEARCGDTFCALLLVSK